MILKKILLFILIIILLLVSFSCTKDNNFLSNDRRILSKIERTYEKYKGYKCKANISIFSGENNSMYLIEETYNKPNKYKLEILKPNESKGIIILNTNDKIFVEHPTINQSISLVAIKSLNKQLLIGDFFEDVYKANRLSNDKINNEEYLVFEYKLEDKNKYRESARIWLKKKKFTPYKLNIYDKNGSLQVEIIYDNFKFLRRTKENLFGR